MLAVVGVYIIVPHKRCTLRAHTVRFIISFVLSERVHGSAQARVSKKVEKTKLFDDMHSPL